MLKRAKLSLVNNRFVVDLPTYGMVDGSFLPVSAALMAPTGPLLPLKLGAVDADPAAQSTQFANIMALAPTVLCEVPDAWFDDKGSLDVAAFRAMYAGTRFGAPSWSAPFVASS